MYAQTVLSATCFHSIPPAQIRMTDTLRPAGTSWRPMGASLVWLHASLQSLDTALRRRFGSGAGIIFRRGPYLDALKDVAAKAETRCIHYSRR